MSDPRNKPIALHFTVADPAAGVTFSITPNTASDWLIRSLRFLFTTDANAATRHVTINVNVGGLEYRHVLSSGQQTASTARLYAGSEGTSAVISLGSSITLAFPLQGVWLPNGHTMTVEVDNIQAGDQFSAIAGYRFEFPLGPREHVWPFLPVLLEESS